MPKTKISEYSSTPANNTDIDGIDLGEGTMVVSDVNNALREQMAHLKDFITGAGGDSVTVGGNLVVSGSATITSGSITGITDLAVADGGTGASTAQNARVNLLPSYSTNGGKVLAVNTGATDVEWVSAGTGDVAGPASSTDNAIVRFDGTTGKLVQNSAVTIDDTTGSLNFTATGARITGDFSNATASNRVMFQSSTTNGNTIVGAVPNGTAVTSALFLHNNSDPANSGYLNLNATSTAVNFNSTIAGTGSYLPVAFYTGGAERMRIDTSGNVGIGMSSSIPIKLTLGEGSNGYGGINFSRSSPNNFTDIYGLGETGGWEGNLRFFTSSNSTTGTERMRIDSSGNVEIKGSSTQAGTLRLYEDTDNGTNYVSVAAPASVSSNVSLTLPSTAGLNGQVMTVDGSGNLSFSYARFNPSSISNTQTFTTVGSNTWTKPSSGTFALVRVWGAGGSGGKGTSTGPAGGGGGGAFVEKLFLLSELTSTVTVTVGAGGAAQTTASTGGNAGGNTTFGSYVTAYGGGAGAYNAAGGGGGGGGGGGSAGASGVGTGGGLGGSDGITTSKAWSITNVVNSSGGVSEVTGVSSVQNQISGAGGRGGGYDQNCVTINAGASGGDYGGGGGGQGRDASGVATANIGGNSVWGGGGGGGAANSIAGGNAGTSTYGGNGSAGVIDANNSAAGAQPGGGSGGTEGGDSGKGGDGQCIVYVY